MGRPKKSFWKNCGTILNPIAGAGRNCRKIAIMWLRCYGKGRSVLARLLPGSWNGCAGPVVWCAIEANRLRSRQASDTLKNGHCDAVQGGAEATDLPPEGRRAVFPGPSSFNQMNESLSPGSSVKPSCYEEEMTRPAKKGQGPLLPVGPAIYFSCGQSRRMGLPFPIPQGEEGKCRLLIKAQIHSR